MTSAASDRRQGDRRRSDRRAPPRRGGDAWLGGDSFFDPGWLTVRQEGRGESGDTALARIYRTYAAARAAFGLALVAAQGASNLLGAHTSIALVLLTVAYAGQATALWLLPRFRTLTAARVPAAQRGRQWLATIGVDLFAFGAMHIVESGSSFNYAALLVLPVLMAGVMTQRVLALGTAAGVTLMLLVASWRSGLAAGDVTAQTLQAGLAGAGLFAIVLLSSELAARLVREELAARGSLELARQQAQLNRLVIEEMADGVLVVDDEGRVRAANPAARALLAEIGLCPPAPFELGAREAWTELAQAVARARAEAEWPEAGRDVTLEFGDGMRRTLRMRVRFMRHALPPLAEAGSRPFAVLLLEDVRTAEARLRQEKLAAMGRVSAGIAHEIRNPLAAITQANALLLEDPLEPAQQRLARIVADNAQRLARIVADVMEIAPGGPVAALAIDANAEVSEAAADWAAMAGLALGAGSRLQVELPSQPLGVWFEPEHLRRVLVNLLDNAHRHAGAEAGAIRLRLAAADDNHAQLSVASDGAPIPAEVERYLFEPFFSTRSRGTGLGLYICRELCERYGASIDLHTLAASERARNVFLVTMKRAPLAAVSTPLFPNP